MLLSQDRFESHKYTYFLMQDEGGRRILIPKKENWSSAIISGGVGLSPQNLAKRMKAFSVLVVAICLRFHTKLHPKIFKTVSYFLLHESGQDHTPKWYDCKQT